MTNNDLRRDVKNRTKARKQAERQTDWDTWGDRLITLIVVVSVLIVFLELLGGADELIRLIELS